MTLRPLSERDVRMAAHPRTGLVQVQAGHRCMCVTRGCGRTAAPGSAFCPDCQRHTINPRSAA